MDIERHLTDLEQLLVEARPVPLSASVMVHRQDLEDAVAAVRDALPEELRQARWVVKEREELLARAAREAEQIRSDAVAERDRLVADTEVTRAAAREAEHILEEARAQARTLRLEAEDYVDAKLADFEAVLRRTLAAVEKGRERLRGQLGGDEALVDDEPAQTPSPDSRRAGTPLYDHESAAPAARPADGPAGDQSGPPTRGDGAQR